MRISNAILTMTKIEQNTSAVLENTWLIPSIAENTKQIPKLLEEIKRLLENIQPGFASRFRQVQAEVQAVKARFGTWALQGDPCAQRRLYLQNLIIVLIND